jgi:hypothetical protein
MSLKPARISGQVPAGYSGPIFYRIGNYLKPNPPSKVLFDYLKFPGRDVKGVNRIVGLVVRDAISDTSKYTTYLNEDGHVEPEWSIPIRAVPKANYREDWPEFSINNVMLVSERLKNCIEKYEKHNHAFVTVNVESAEGELLFKAFVMVGGNAIDAVDYVVSGIVPSKVFPGGKASWLPRIALPSNEFCHLKRSLVEGRHHFWDEKLGHVWSQQIVDELGDILPKEFLFIPMGVTG